MEIALLRKTIDCWDAYDVQPVNLSANHRKGACPPRGGLPQGYSRCSSIKIAMPSSSLLAVT